MAKAGILPSWDEADDAVPARAGRRAVPPPFRPNLDLFFAVTLL
jgi:hypothetical protein